MTAVHTQNTDMALLLLLLPLLLDKKKITAKKDDDHGMAHLLSIHLITVTLLFGLMVDLTFFK